MLLLLGGKGKYATIDVSSRSSGDMHSPHQATMPLPDESTLLARETSPEGSGHGGLLSHAGSRDRLRTNLHIDHEFLDGTRRRHF